jgi:hypothetical protein
MVNMCLILYIEKIKIMDTKYLMKEINMIIFVLWVTCMFSCNSLLHNENTYELLITQIYHENFKDKDKFDERDTKISLIAVEYDKNRILQQLYCDNVRVGNNSFYVAGKNILNEGLQKHKNSLKDPHNCFVFKMDFNRFVYRDFDVDITKENNYIFLSNRLNSSWTPDSIPLAEFMNYSIILIESDYIAKIGDSICIPHACRLIRNVYLSNNDDADYYRRIKHTIIYDRNRQMIVAAERRHAYTNKLLSKYELVKIIKLTRNEFYEFWTGEK